MGLLNARESKPLLGGASFSLQHRLFRVVWSLAWLLFAAWTPPPLRRWRAWLLRRFGADVHPRAYVYGSVRVWYPPNLTMEANSCLGPDVNCYCMAPIHIGANAVVSQGAHLCAGTHDIEDPEFQLTVRPIVIGKNVWIAAEAFVGPGVVVEEGAVLGARAVLFKNAEAFGVYLGNPAKLVRHRELAHQGEQDPARGATAG